MNGYEICRRARETHAQLEAARAQFELLGDVQRGLVADYDGVHVSGSGSRDAMAAMCAQRDEVAQRCKQLEKLYSVEATYAARVLATLYGLRTTVMYCYYIAGASVNDIATAINRTPGTVKRLKREGIKLVRGLDIKMPDWYVGQNYGENDTPVIPK